MRLGLGAQFGLGAAASLALAGALIYGAWRLQHEGDMRLVEFSAASMQTHAREDLERRGEAIALLLSEALVNPVYFNDLQAIGQVAQSVLHQPDVEYVLVFDAQGRILHDGSTDIADFGQPMRDAFGPADAPAAGPLVQVVANGGSDWVTHLCSITVAVNAFPAWTPAGAWSSSSAGFGFGKLSGAR